MLLLYVLQEKAEEKIMRFPRNDGKLGGIQELAAGEYEKLNMDKLLGTSGYFEVLDEDNKVVYTDSDTGEVNYTEREVECILEYDSPQQYMVTTYETQDGQKQTLVTKRRYEQDTGYQEDETYILLDENLHVILSNGPYENETFTGRELNFLTMREVQGIVFVSMTLWGMILENIRWLCILKKWMVKGIRGCLPCGRFFFQSML